MAARGDNGMVGRVGAILGRERRGTPLYRRRTEAIEGVGRALTALAEGLSLQGTARLCRVEVETVALWLELAGSHFVDLAEYLSHHLELDQIQLDERLILLHSFFPQFLHYNRGRETLLFSSYVA